jgi:hypothetical protein
MINLIVQKFLKTLVKDTRDLADISYDNATPDNISPIKDAIADVDAFDPAWDDSQSLHKAFRL